MGWGWWLTTQSSPHIHVWVSVFGRILTSCQPTSHGFFGGYHPQPWLGSLILFSFNSFLLELKNKGNQQNMFFSGLWKIDHVCCITIKVRGVLTLTGDFCVSCCVFLHPRHDDPQCLLGRHVICGVRRIAMDTLPLKMNFCCGVSILSALQTG